MSPDIIANENISNSIILSLRSANYKVISIRTDFPGLEDSEIIRIAADNNSIVLTEDRDFGEWVFSHKVQNSGIIYLRYEYNDRNIIIAMLLSVLSRFSCTLYNKFTVITPDRIRIREI